MALDSRQKWDEGRVHSDSSIIDLENVEEGFDFGDKTGHPTHASREGESNYVHDLRDKLTSNVSQMFWEAGKKQATQAWSIYGNIDILRPYFDVETKEVADRLLQSFIPKKSFSSEQRIPSELYGPLMIQLTMIALLLLQMKSADHKVEDGTLIGTAFGVCFTYWFGAGALIWIASYVCNTHLGFLQILSMLGYASFGNCFVVLVGAFTKSTHEHWIFFLLWTVVGGVTALKMVTIVISKTQGRRQRLIVCSCVTSVHLLFLLYVHYAYHYTVTDIL